MAAFLPQKIFLRIIFNVVMNLLLEYFNEQYSISKGGLIFYNEYSISYN